MHFLPRTVFDAARYFPRILSVLLLTLDQPLPSKASGIVDNCDEVSLRAALSGGGLVTFTCEGTFALSSPLVISNGTHTIIDAGTNSVVISGQNLTRIMIVESNASALVIGMTFVDSLVVGTNAAPPPCCRAAQGGPAEGAGIVNSGSLQLVSCTLSNLVAQAGAGSSPGDAIDPGGGGTASGGGVWNSGSLTITNCFLTNCRTLGGEGGEAPRSFGGFGGAARGGAVFNSGGVVECVESTFKDNHAIGGPFGENPYSGGSFGRGEGGAVYSLGGTMIIDRCVFDDNVTEGGTTTGGAVCVTNCPTTIRFSDFRRNSGRGRYGPRYGSARTRGGAIGALATPAPRLEQNYFNANSVTGGNPSEGGAVFGEISLVMEGCTLASNRATGSTGNCQLGSYGHRSGRGLGAGLSCRGYLWATNCTLAQNLAFGGNNGGDCGSRGEDGLGGGLFFSGTNATLVNVTIASNEARGGMGNTSRGTGYGGGIMIEEGSLTVFNSIIARNVEGGDCSGTPIDGGSNLSSDSSCSFDHPDSFNNTDPRLVRLSDHGGFTRTYSLNYASPALDAGALSVAPSFDQRGVSRPQGTHVDIGAFEANHIVLMPGPEGAILVSYEDRPGRGYTLQATTNFLNWDSVSSEQADGTGKVLFEDPDASLFPHRFYRVREP